MDRDAIFEATKRFAERWPVRRYRPRPGNIRLDAKPPNAGCARSSIGRSKPCPQGSFARALLRTRHRHLRSATAGARGEFPGNREPRSEAAAGGSFGRAGTPAPRAASRAAPAAAIAERAPPGRHGFASTTKSCFSLQNRRCGDQASGEPTRRWRIDLPFAKVPRHALPTRHRSDPRVCIVLRHTVSCA